MKGAVADNVSFRLSRNDYNLEHSSVPSARARRRLERGIDTSSAYSDGDSDELVAPTNDDGNPLPETPYPSAGLPFPSKDRRTKQGLTWFRGK